VKGWLQFLIPIIAGRLKIVFEEEKRLQLKICQHSAASEQTISFIKQTSDELTPNFPNVNSRCILLMIQRTRNLLTRNRTVGKISEKTAAKETFLQQRLHILKEFEEICLIVDALKK